MLVLVLTPSVVVVVGVVQAMSLKSVKPVAGDADSVTGSAPGVVTALPAASCDCTASGPEQLPTGSVCGIETMTSCVGKPAGFTRTRNIAVPRPGDDAV